MSMRPFQTDKGAHIHVFPITITMGASATFRCVIYSSSSTYDKVFNLEKEDYANWGSSDDYIKEYICNKEGFIGRPLPELDADGNPIVYEPIINSDNHSVHNPNDLELITNLKSQLDEQKSKIDQINKLLLSRGIL